MKAVVFDLGDTLIEYEGLPLNWESHYPQALEDLAVFLGGKLDPDSLARGCETLRRFNTRINPRDHEVPFYRIAEEIAKSINLSAGSDSLACARSFFRRFRARLRTFADALPTLHHLRNSGVLVGIFTDVPYGMPRELVLDDVSQAGLAGSFDILATSLDAGFRKPHIETLRLMARELKSSAAEMVHVGNEKKDIEVARAFGCRSVLVDRAQSRQDWSQDQTVSSLDQLLRP